VISIPALMQDRALATLVPHTTSPRSSRFEIDVKVRFLKPGAFDVQNLVTIPHAKLLRKLGELDSEQLSQVEDVLLFWPGLKLLPFMLRGIASKLFRQAGKQLIATQH